MNSRLTDIELSSYKYLHHLEKLKKLAQGGDVLPVTVELDLVDYCNHHCDWCVDPMHADHALPVNVAIALINELRRLGIRGIVYKGGGEPTLYPDFGRILEETKSLGFEIGIVTNGSRLNNQYREIVSCASYLRVSIDGPTPDSHATIHQSDDFEIIIDGVRRTVSQREQDHQRHPIVGLSFAMDYLMINLIEDAVALGESLGVDYVLFRPPFFEEVGRVSTMTNDEAQEVRTRFQRAKVNYTGDMNILVDHWISDREAQAGVTVKHDSPRRGSAAEANSNGIEHLTGRCLASPLLAVITGDQKVYPCCNLRSLDEWCIGRLDLDNGISFAGIWQGEQRKRVMQRIHRAECLKHCTHPLSRYNEIIEYLMGPAHHASFI